MSHHASKKPTVELTAANFAAPDSLGRIQSAALVIAVLGIAASAFGYFQNSEQFFRSYLVSYVFWLSIGLGGLALMMIQHMSQGAWGLIPRRINEASAGALLVMVPLFLPIWFGLKAIYSWARPEVLEESHLIAKKVWFLNPEGFALRVLLYFVIWLLMTALLRRQSSAQDREATVGQILAMRRVSGPGLVIFAVVGTLASIDFMMSIDPEYYSSIYGIYFMGTTALAGMTFTILMEAHLAKHKPMDQVLRPSIFHAQGKLLLAFTMLWAYFCVSQFLLTWQGNIPEEVKWYQHRFAGGWNVIAVSLALLHFALPFLLLLSRPLKRSFGTLSTVALIL
ncbi:MAG: hypothetical protein KDD11_05105, partial [Acidobacteria bacterium]|nr:hypothetical protein [Acidobacteriota bacterium]